MLISVRAVSLHAASLTVMQEQLPVMSCGTGMAGYDSKVCASLQNLEPQPINGS